LDHREPYACSVQLEAMSKAMEQFEVERQRIINSGEQGVPF
jgi:hypothetical protein